MKNIGPVSRKWLAEVGIHTVEELRAAGSISIYRMLKEVYPERVSLNLLWGLEAAVRDVDWRDLTDTDKGELKKKTISKVQLVWPETSPAMSAKFLWKILNLQPQNRS